MKWTMIDFTHFLGVNGIYTCTIRKSSIGWIWFLNYDGIEIDNCYHYKPTDSELSCKVQVQRVVEKLLNKEPNAEVSDTTGA